MQTTTEESTAQNTFNPYTRARHENELDLVDEVRKLLVESGLSKSLYLYENNRFILEAKDKAPGVQRFLLNRFWTLQLSLCPDSLQERYCLIPDGKVEDWLSLFKIKILPFILQKGLPKEI